MGDRSESKKQGTDGLHKWLRLFGLCVASYLMYQALSAHVWVNEYEPESAGSMIKALVSSESRKELVDGLSKMEQQQATQKVSR